MGQGWGTANKGNAIGQVPAGAAGVQFYQGPLGDRVDLTSQVATRGLLSG